MTITPRPRPARQGRGPSQGQHPRGCQPGADSGDRHRPYEPLRHRPRKGTFQGLRGQEAAADHAVFKRGRAAFGGAAFRLQRQHGHETARDRAKPWRSSSRPPIPRTSSSWCNSSDTADLVQGFTSSLEDIQNRLQFTQSKGMTALLDAIYLGIHEMKKAHESAQGAADHFRRRRQQQPLHRDRNPQPGERSRRPDLCHRNLRTRRARAAARWKRATGPALLTELAEQTGGRQYQVENLSELPDIAAKIGVELRNQYVLGYSPQNQRARREIPARGGQTGAAARDAALRAFLRMGYNAPCQLSVGASMRSSWPPRSGRGGRCAGQQQPSAGDAPAVFRTETRVVVCNTTVVDKNGHLVTDLAREHFQRLRERRGRRTSPTSGTRTCRFRSG